MNMASCKLSLQSIMSCFQDIHAFVVDKQMHDCQKELLC